MDRLTNLLAAATLIEMMAAIGLGVTLAQIAAVAKDWRLIGRAAAANYLLAPAAATALLLAFGPKPEVAAGFLIVAACPGAPYGPPFAKLAGGDEALAVGLMAVMAASSAVAAPLLLGALLPIFAGASALRVDAAKMAAALGLVQFVPLAFGLFIRARFPALAQRLLKPARAVSLALNIATLSAILAAQYRMLMDIRWAGYLGMLALVGLMAGSGWLLGGPGAGRRKTLAVSTAVRNVGVGLVIATGSFPGTLAVAAATAYGLFQTAAMALIALAWGRWDPPARGAKEQAAQAA